MRITSLCLEIKWNRSGKTTSIVPSVVVVPLVRVNLARKDLTPAHPLNTFFSASSGFALGAVVAVAGGWVAVGTAVGVGGTVGGALVLVGVGLFAGPPCSTSHALVLSMTSSVPMIKIFFNSSS